MMLDRRFAWKVAMAWALIGPTAEARDEGRAAADDEIARAANGEPILVPTSKQTIAIVDGGKTVEIPRGMVYVAAGPFTSGAGRNARTVELGGYAIGRFSVTNAEFKAFVDANGSRFAPRYWKGGAIPEGKANHPVASVSLDAARAYAAWVSRETGRDVRIPTAEQWEKAARGPKNTLYPWGDRLDISYRDGKLSTPMNYNGVLVAEALRDPSKVVTYNNRKSPHFGEKTTAGRIAAFDAAGRPTYLTLGPTGQVRGFVEHATSSGFTGTDLYASYADRGGNTTPVGFYEAGKGGYGAYDMAGNLWNWTETKVVASNGAERGRTVNEIRGGSWYSNARSAQAAGVGEGREASGQYHSVGFRIVMIPPAAP